ncbi:MAG: hypothetical protein QG670_1454 [Thermoproteota archaeon]|nr:hypothetical protein [Thermoproteota archaeon]
MAKNTRSAAKIPIPAVIKRNTILLAATQALFQGAIQSVVVIAPLSIFYFTQSTVLGALAFSVVIGGRTLVAYSAGRFMDSVGRKKVLYAGIFVSCSALIVMTFALYIFSIWFFWIGVFIFSIGAGVMNMLRVPVTDMYPTSRLGEGMGYMLTGSIIGALIPTVLSSLASFFAFTSLNAYEIMLLFSVPMMAIGILLVKLISPDTREILRNLKSYYPQDVNVATYIDGKQDLTSVQVTSRSRSVIAAFIASSFGWGGMVMSKSIISIMLQQLGVELTLINLALSIHVFGMFGPSIPWGWLTDRWGRRIVIALGGVILGTGAFFMPITRDYRIVTFGFFLIGLGWSATNVASTALLCDLTTEQRRGSMLGANDVANGLASLTFPTVGGIVLSSFGLFAFGMVGMLAALPIVLSMILSIVASVEE